MRPGAVVFALLGVALQACALQHPSLGDASGPPEDTAPWDDRPPFDAADAPPEDTGLDPDVTGRCGLEGNPCCAPGTCDSGLVCASGRCAASCPSGQTPCGDVCRDLTRDRDHCGTCDRACPRGPDATAVCAEGACGLTCDPGRGDCDGDLATGCETNTRADPDHCGACGAACATAHGTPACVSGACATGACSAPWEDCDRNPSNGCEANTASYNRHCGACGNVCPTGTVCSRGACTAICEAGTTLCSGMCVDLQSDPMFCGSCGVSCPSRPNAFPACQRGACGIRCAAGFADCDSNPATGCEVNLATNPSHCGGCGTRCPAPPSTTATCASSRCGAACVTGRADCDGNASNGCETDPATSTSHCGGCGRRCPTGATCSGGVCRCPTGQTDCSGACVDLTRDTRHCGGCGRVCPARGGATVTCVASTCGFTCVAGRADCDGNASNGCEVDLATSAAHCGVCGRACPMGATCAGGTCRCPSGRSDCGGVCADLGRDPLNCGACAHVCDAGPRGEASCASSVCTLLCDAGWGDCDGAVMNGCETGLATSLTHCGMCGRACPSGANATAQCATGACSLRCNTGYGNCDSNAGNGCETDLRSSVAHCNACGRACPARSNAMPVCASSACSISCNAGWGDCDGNAGNGCETDVTSSEEHCGACGTRCGAGRRCASGRCTPCGGAGQVCCDGDPACSAVGVACVTYRGSTGAVLEYCLRDPTLMGEGGTGPNPGSAGGTCSGSGTNDCVPGLVCLAGTDRLEHPVAYCVACGADGQRCCTGNVCGSGLNCRTPPPGSQCRP